MVTGDLLHWPVDGLVVPGGRGHTFYPRGGTDLVPFPDAVMPGTSGHGGGLVANLP